MRKVFAMEIYLCYTCVGEYEDAFVNVEATFRSLDDARAFFVNNGFTQTGIEKASDMPYYERKEKVFDEEPQRSWYHSDEEFAAATNQWLDDIENDNYSYSEDWIGWISKIELQ